MPRYFFHLDDGTDLLDTEGTVLADLETARHEAVAYLGRLLSDNAEQFWVCSRWAVRVTDESGTEQFSLNVSAQAPAGGSLRGGLPRHPGEGA